MAYQMASIQGFELMPTLEEEEELITLATILRLRDHDLKEEELWSICQETCLALQSIEKTAPDLFHQLCLHPDTLGFNAAGGVSFLDRDADIESYLPPEHKKGIGTIEGHLFSIGKTLQEAARKPLSPSEDGNPKFGNNLFGLLDQMVAKEPVKRPLIGDIITKCSIFLKKDSSKVVCTKLTAWGRRRLSLESTQNYDVNHLKELSAIKEECSDLNNSAFADEKRELNSQSEDHLKKQRRSLPKVPQKDIQKLKKLTEKVRKEHNTDAMERSTLTPPNLDAFGNLSERAQEILRKIYDSSDQTNGGKEQGLARDETGDGATRSKPHTSVKSKAEKPTGIKPHLLKRNSVASIGTSLGPSLRFLRSQRDGVEEAQAEKSRSMGAIKVAGSVSGKEDGGEMIPVVNVDEGSPQMKRVSSASDIEDEAEALERYLKCRQNLYMNNERNKSPITGEKSESSGEGRLKSASSPNLMGSVDFESHSEDISELPEDFALDDLWSEESDFESTPEIKQKVRSHSIAAFSVLDPRSSAFRTPGQRKLSSSSKASRSSNDRASVLSNSSTDHESQSETVSKKVETENQTALNFVPPSFHTDKVGNGFRRHSLEASNLTKEKQPQGKRRSTVADLRTMPSGYTSTATHFTPIIVAGENFVKSSDKLATPDTDAKLKARMAFEAIKKAPRKERPPKTMASDIEKDAESSKILSVENPGDANSKTSDCLVKEPSKELQPSSDLKNACSEKIDKAGLETSGNGPPDKENDFETSNTCDVKVKEESVKSISEKPGGKVLSLCEEQNHAISESRVEEKFSTVSLESSKMTSDCIPEKISLKSDDKEKGKGAEMDREIVDKGSEPKPLLVASVSALPSAILTDAKLQTAKVKVVAGSPLSERSLFSPIDKPEVSQHEPVDSKHDSLMSSSCEVNTCKNHSKSLECQDIKTDKEMSTGAQVNLNSEQPKFVPGGLFPPTSLPNSPLVVPQPVHASSHISPGLVSGGQLLAGTPLTGGAFAPGQFPFVIHPLNGNQGVANGDSGSPLSVNPMGYPLNSSQTAPGYQNFSMQVQFQQDPQTGLFRMIPLGVPAFPVNASPVLSSSPLYSPINHLTSPQHHSSPLASVQTTTVPKKKTSSPGKSFDTSSDPDSGDLLRKRTPADKRRDPSKPSVDKSKLSSSLSTGKKTHSTRRSGTRLPSDSESSESSMFSPKPSSLKMDKYPVKPSRHKSKSLSSNNSEEKGKKLPKRNSADPAIGRRVDAATRDRSGDSTNSSKLDKSSPSKGDAKVNSKSQDKSKHQTGTKLRSGAAVYGSPLTVSSPSRDSGVHMRYSMSSGEELSVANERQGQVSDHASSNVMLKRVIRHIRHAFAFDGYLENGVEDLHMAEYITSLAHLSWSTFSSAITEKFCDLYWEEELLESLYEEVNAKKIDKTAASKVQKEPVRSRHRARSPSKKPHSKRESSSSIEQQDEKTKATQEKEKNLPQLSRSVKSSSSSSPRKVKRSSLDSQRSTASLTNSLECDIDDLLPDEDNLAPPSSRNTQRDKRDSSPTRSKSGSKSERRLSSSETKIVDGVDKSPPKDIEKLKMDERSRKSMNQEDGSEITTNPVKSRMKHKREINNNDLVKSVNKESIKQLSSNMVETFSSAVTANDASSKTSTVRDDGLSDHDRCSEQNVRSLSLLSYQNSVDGSDQLPPQTDQFNGEPLLDEVPKSPEISSRFSSPPPSSRMSQRSSPLFQSGGSSEKRDASPLSTSLSLSEFSFPSGLPYISRTESEIGSRSSTPSAQRIRQMLDSAITRSSSNASLNSTSSGNSSNQGLGRSSLSGVSSTRSLGDEVRKLQSGLMYGESVFDDEVIEYSRNLGGHEKKGDEIEKKIKEVEQQISMEKKMLAKTEKFYRKLMENQSNKGADHKTMLTKVGHQLEEMETKLSFLDSVRCHLELTYAEQWGLEHNLLYSFATSGKLMNLQPHADNPMLQIKSIEKGSCLQAGKPQGLFSYLFAKRAVMEGYLYQFLYTFRYFSKKQDLLSFIIEKFQTAEGLPIGLEECKKQISFRTVDIFHVWIEGFFEVDFRPDTDLMAEVISFISEKLVQVDQQGQALLQLIDLKDKSDGLTPVNDHNENSTTGSPFLSNLPGQGKSSQAPFTSRKGNKDRLSVGGIMACFSKKSQKSGGDSAYLPVIAMNKEGFSLSEHTSQTLAWQLTLIQQELFQKVHPVHYLDSRHKGVGVKSTLDATLSKPSQKYDNGDYPSLFIETTADGGISQLLHYARNVSHWAAAEIVSCSSSKAQVALISKFINIAKVCYDMRNFATSIQILDGLNNLIVRQIPAWKNLPSKVVAIYEELEAAGVLLKGDSEFLVQGNQHKHLPTLPSTHLTLMHIQQLEIGGFKLANGMYKWPKLKAIGELVDQIRIFQQCRYTLEPDEQLQGLLQSRIDEFQSTDIQILAASNTSNFHQLSSEKGSKKFQNALQKVKANLY
ncbi:Kinase non-catalytic C-lobe domain-containing protein 1 [Holothuria leucospilota]|uniref:Kinase non-catalytic C-lobe domain-containing protein 1 n=1 Tax=Holothuria leucospilota TaxID=206669 RepID=A0A9Q0YRM9_HOLLE|nr:Kinase non-catalytic C-lobe domain-containing protein 1 [Holothuria leucospilota]